MKPRQPAAPIAILHLEDDARDAELVAAQLKSAGLKCAITVVDDERSLRDALATRTFDLVISDNRLRGFDGLAALRIVRDAGIDVPFVFVSGTIGEEVAIEAMRAGASDYVLKHRLEKLPLTIDRLLRESRDQCERARMEAALHERERLFTQLAQSIREVFWVTSNDQSRVLYVSPAYEELWGEPVASLYRNPASKYDKVHPDDRCVLADVLRTVGSPGGVTFKYRIQRPDGTRWILERAWPSVDEDGRAAGIAGVARDVTDQVELHEQLLQARKLEAVGRLAGGVAHDFNNMLSVILGHCELLLDDRPPDHPDRESIDMILQSAHRAAGLTRQLLAFSRRQVLQPRVLDLNAIIVDMSKMLRRVIGEHIALESTLSQNLGRVRADPGQIEQVVMNLVVNARDAMPGGGSVRISTADAVVSADLARMHAGAAAGPYVMVSVQDSGAGMTPEVRSRIFEPFFTTKEERGTGLGLATVLGIVEQSGGYIEVDSEVGQGTMFRILLPRVNANVDAPVPQSERRPTTKRSETVLLVEDDDEVRRLATTVLKRSGYSILEASTAERALQIAASHAGAIHILLTDVVLPGQTGVVLAEGLRRARPDMRVLLMSGYMPTAIQEDAEMNGFPMVEKPFTARSLAQRMADVLDLPAPKA